MMDFTVAQRDQTRADGDERAAQGEASRRRRQHDERAPHAAGVRVVVIHGGEDAPRPTCCRRAARWDALVLEGAKAASPTRSPRASALKTGARPRAPTSALAARRRARRDPAHGEDLGAQRAAQLVRPDRAALNAARRRCQGRGRGGGEPCSTVAFSKTRSRARGACARRTRRPRPRSSCATCCSRRRS